MNAKKPKQIVVSIECNVKIGDSVVVKGKLVRIVDIQVEASMLAQQAFIRLYYHNPDTNDFEYIELDSKACVTDKPKELN